MTAYEMLLSESQERMLIVAHAGREREVIDIFRKWDLDAVVIGRVREGRSMRVVHHGETVADIPVAALTDEAPKYQRPQATPAPAANTQKAGALRSGTESASDDLNESLAQMLAAPNIASKQWVYRQYDHMVRTNTAVLPGADAAVVRIKETRRALAMSLDGNGRYCAADPRAGARLVVAEAARNVVCAGARPMAITNCLNFASPERPEVMWAFSETVDGMAESCRALGTPVVSGNVSFYNETEGNGILPTPVIGMVGLVEDAHRVIQAGFKRDGDLIALLGETGDDLSISEFASTIRGQSTSEMIANGAVPQLDLERECSVQAACLGAAEEGQLHSAHDCADGGLAVALAECCFSTLNNPARGAEIALKGELSHESILFSESPSRIIISFAESSLARINEIAAAAQAPLTVIGRCGGSSLRISINGAPVIDRSIAQLEEIWRSALGKKLGVEALTVASD